MADPYRYFRVEAREILDQLQKQLLELERGTASADSVKSMLRLAHTLKGAARVVKQREIGDLSHSLEDLLVVLRDDPTADRASTTTRGLAIVDALEARLATLDAAPEAPKPARTTGGTAEPAPTAVERATRTDLDELDGLITGVQEVSARLATLGRALAGFSHARTLADLVLSGLSPRKQEGEKRQLEQTRSLSEELARVLPSLERELGTGLEQATRELEQVHETAERLRLVPALTMFGALERTARDAAVNLGKLVAFTARGGDVRLDAGLLALVQSALVQAVRNAVAHGIEGPAERSAAGKAREGAVTLEVTRRDRYVVFSCRDDGRGLDLEAIRRAAAAKGVATEVVRALDDRALVELLLKGGISTAGAVTAVSGRGVGLDLLRETAERAGGKLTLESDAGRGSTLELCVPAALSALETLTLEIEGEVVSVPLDSVRRTLRVASAELVRGADGERLRVEDELVAFAPLDVLLGFDALGDSRDARRSAVVIESSSGRAAIGVDRLLGTETAVARAVPEVARPKSVVLAASLDARGNPRLLLDPHELVAAVKRAGLPARAPQKTRAPILVVDDSLTTRMLEQSILESAGYEVDLATSGEEGLSMAALRRYALFLVDVEMPGMDGFTFVERTRRDPRFSAIPAILVTSRASPEDLSRGRSAGAAAHIVKGDFDQADFLARIRRLVG
jgi:two-component system chemotaxis sensor kinase CheA